MKFIEKPWGSEEVIEINEKYMVKKLTMKKRIQLIPAARMASPDEIANYIVGLISEKNTYMTGQTVTVAGGE